MRFLIIILVLSFLPPLPLSAEEAKNDVPVAFSKGDAYMRKGGWEYFFVKDYKKVIVRSPTGEIVRDYSRAIQFLDEIEEFIRKQGWDREGGGSELRFALLDARGAAHKDWLDGFLNGTATAAAGTIAGAALIAGLIKVDKKYGLFGGTYYYSTRLMESRIQATASRLAELEKVLKKISGSRNEWSTLTEVNRARLTELRKICREANELHGLWNRVRNQGQRGADLAELENQAQGLEKRFKRIFDDLRESYDGTRPFEANERAYERTAEKPMSSPRQPGEITDYKEQSSSRGKYWQRYSVFPSEFMHGAEEVADACVTMLADLTEKEGHQLKKVASQTQRLAAEEAFDNVLSYFYNFRSAAGVIAAGTAYGSYQFSRLREGRLANSPDVYWSDKVRGPNGQTKTIELPKRERFER